MRILKSWLGDFVDIKISDEELAEKLVTVSGTDIDSIVKTIGDNIIVAQILEIEPHPNADRLRLAKVSTGSEELLVVCGAPNIQVGQKVPLAKIGSNVSGFVIQKASIRGVESNGMLCSEKELGIGTDHSGIKILDDLSEVGQSASKYLKSDIILDLEITPNRGDLLSHLGIAREIAAFNQQSIKYKEKEMPAGSGSPVKIDIDESDLCPRYFALLIDGLKIGPSPEWLSKRLIALGLKPINNIVDATNYVMLEIGQPLHAFDARMVKDKNIIVRKAKAGETLTTLDGSQRKLDTDMLVIADSEKPIALAGIMGGLESGVSEKTTDIILESAEFDRKSVRKTSKRLGIQTDASYRFERGIDPLGTEPALMRLAFLITEIAGGNINGGISSFSTKYEDRTIAASYTKINGLLGLDLSPKEINSTLSSLGFKVRASQSEEEGEYIVPSWRHDVEIWQDLAEEVGRIYGYDNIPEHEVPVTAQPGNLQYNLKEYLKDSLVSMGFVEVKNYPFLSEPDIKAAQIGVKDLLEIANPIQSENKYLRNSTIPSLIKDVAKNPAFDPVLVFEIGNVFNNANECTMLGVVAAGKNAKKAISDARNVVLGITNLAEDSIVISELPREELGRFKVRKPAVFAFEVNVADVINQLKIGPENLTQPAAAKSIPRFRSVSQYPSVTRDIAVIVESNTDSGDIIKSIYETSEQVLLVELFDEFSSDKFGHNKKSMAFHLFLQHLDRTLTDNEANETMSKITTMLIDKYGAKIR